MNAKRNLCELQKKVVDIFKAQDPDTGYFDVVFEINGKKLYAHRYRLTAISSIFGSMLSHRWTSNKDESIKIKDYEFKDFKEFLTFIYSGKCCLNNENIFTMYDMAEFYDVVTFKNVCWQYLSNIKINNENIFQMLELADKYSIAHLQKRLKNFVIGNFTTFTQNEAFQSIGKSLMKNIIEANKNSVLSETLFKEVYKWAENKSIEKQKVDENINLDDAIKEELSGILPLINFQRMDFKFLLQFFVKKSFLFSSDYLSEILLNAWRRVYVKVHDRNGKTMKGFLNCPDVEGIAAIILSQKDIISDGVTGWSTGHPKPASPCTLIENYGIEWYLVINDEGVLNLQQYLDNGDYVLAEMFAEDGFHKQHKIEIHRSA